MIKIFLGNVGSGKTACYVRELILNPANRVTFSNIRTKGIPNNFLISKDMIVKKDIVDYKTKKDGTSVPVEKESLNVDFWKDAVVKHKNLNVCIDEAHTVLNARRSMSSSSIILTDFLALLRRVLGSAESGYGELTLITQLERRLDVIAKEMATNVRFHRCHYIKSCKGCGYSWQETNDNPEPRWICPLCNSPYVKKHSHRIEVFHFQNIDSYNMWKSFRMSTYHRHYFVNDIEKYFNKYDTLQWDNLLS